MSNQLALIPTQEEMNIIQTIAKCAVDSKYFDKMGGVAGIIMISIYAKEIGVPIATALMGGLQNVMGKITMSPELMNNLIRQAGHRLEIIVSDSTQCKIKGTRKDTGEIHTASFSVEDAKKAGIYKQNGGWDKYPEDMCFARTISRLRRRLFPDVASRSYVHGEIEDAEVEVLEGKKTVFTPAIEPVQIQEFEQKPTATIGIQKAQEIESVIGDDAEYKKRILAHYKIVDMIDLPLEFFDFVLKRAKTYSEERLKSEMENSQEEAINA